MPLKKTQRHFFEQPLIFRIDILVEQRDPPTDANKLILILYLVYYILLTGYALIYNYILSLFLSFYLYSLGGRP